MIIGASTSYTVSRRGLCWNYTYQHDRLLALRFEGQAIHHDVVQANLKCLWMFIQCSIGHIFSFFKWQRQLAVRNIRCICFQCRNSVCKKIQHRCPDQNPCLQQSWTRIRSCCTDLGPISGRLTQNSAFTITIFCLVFLHNFCNSCVSSKFLANPLKMFALSTEIAALVVIFHQLVRGAVTLGADDLLYPKTYWRPSTQTENAIYLNWYSLIGENIARKPRHQTRF